MPERDPMDDPGMIVRVARFVASGEDPSGYFVSANTLLKVIGEVEGVSEAIRSKVVSKIEELIVPGDFVDSLQLGRAIGELMNEETDLEGIWKIDQDMKNLDKVPVVNIRGKPVL
jgi:hypothetical protein